MARREGRERIAASRRRRSELLQWKPYVRFAVLLLALVFLAVLLGWSDSVTFLEW